MPRQHCPIRTGNHRSEWRHRQWYQCASDPSAPAEFVWPPGRPTQEGGRAQSQVPRQHKGLPVPSPRPSPPCRLHMIPPMRKRGRVRRGTRSRAQHGIVADTTAGSHAPRLPPRLHPSVAQRKSRRGGFAHGRVEYLARRSHEETSLLLLFRSVPVQPQDRRLQDEFYHSKGCPRT